MDLNTVSEVARPATREETRGWRDGAPWLAGGTWLFSEPQPGARRLPVVEFVTGNGRNVLGRGELLRGIDLPASALCKRSSFRRMSLTHEGRSSVLLIGTLCLREGAWALTVTAATVRPVRIEF